MAQSQLSISVRKRWFFWPAYIATVLLAKLRIIRDFQRAANWLVEHGIRLEIV